MRLLKRLTELALALSLLAISALTVWALWDTLAHPPDNETPESTLWTIAFILGFISSAGFLFAARLAFPRLRVEGGQIIGFHGFWAFLCLYAVTMALAFWRGAPQAKAGGVAIVLGVLIFLAWRSTFRTPKDHDAAV